MNILFRDQYFKMLQIQIVKDRNMLQYMKPTSVINIKILECRIGIINNEIQNLVARRLSQNQTLSSISNSRESR